MRDHAAGHLQSQPPAGLHHALSGPRAGGPSAPTTQRWRVPPLPQAATGDEVLVSLCAPMPRCLLHNKKSVWRDLSARARFEPVRSMPLWHVTVPSQAQTHANCWYCIVQMRMRTKCEHIAAFHTQHTCRMLSVRAFLMGLVATLFPFMDIPVFWPILLV